MSRRVVDRAGEVVDAAHCQNGGRCLRCGEEVYLDRAAIPAAVRHVSPTDCPGALGVETSAPRCVLVECPLCGRPTNTCRVPTTIATPSWPEPDSCVCTQCIRRLENREPETVVLSVCGKCGRDVRWVHLDSKARWPKWTGKIVNGAVIAGAWSFMDEAVVVVEKGSLDLDGVWVVGSSPEVVLCADCTPPEPEANDLDVPNTPPFARKYIDRFGSEVGTCVVCNAYGDVLEFSATSCWPDRIAIAATQTVPGKIQFCYDCVRPCDRCMYPVGLTASRCSECLLIYD